MNDFDLRRTDVLWLEFEGSNPLQEGGPGLEPFLEAIETYAGEWMPAYVKGKRQRKYSRAASLKALEEHRERTYREVWLVRPPSPEVSLSMTIWKTPSLRQLQISLMVLPLSFFQEPETAAERSRRLIDLCRAWASAYTITHGLVHAHADIQLLPKGKPGYTEEELRQAPREWIPAVYWLNVLGRELVDALGRERVLSTPAHYLDELPNGAVLFVTRPTVADLTSEEARQAQARALVHLRPELDFDTVLRMLRENSASLAPVEPRFPPDVAPFWMRVLDEWAISERQQRIAEFNRRPPPEVEEWLPVNSAPASDVADPRAAIDEYLNLAEGAVVAFHTQVPSVFDRTLEALTDIEVWCWFEHLPTSYDRQWVEKVRVAAGAYLAHVMVLELGGTWVPRRNREEVQVRLGERAWLPFLRARRWLQSRESMLDYSLTQFSRAAQRLQGPSPGK